MVNIMSVVFIEVILMTSFSDSIAQESEVLKCSNAMAEKVKMSIL